MQPRMLVTFDEELRPLPVAVRVGQVSSVLCYCIYPGYLDKHTRANIVEERRRFDQDLHEAWHETVIHPLGIFHFSGGYIN